MFQTPLHVVNGFAWSTNRTLMVFILASALFSGASQAQIHGPGIAISCATPVRACDNDADCSDGNECTAESCDTNIPSTTRCQIRITHVDSFGDSLAIAEAFEIIQAVFGPVRLPASGNLPIISISGNTDCVVGGFLPCSIGADIGFGEGRVTFEAAGYDVTPADLESSNLLMFQGYASFTDLCDGIDPSSCNNILQTITALTAISLIDGCMDPGPPVDCNDGNACTDESCDPVTGQCELTNTVVCDDGDACTNDSCDPVTGQCELTNTVVCDDGNACTDESCDPATGQCELTNTVVCDDGNACTDESCDPATGQCELTNSVVCDDADACTNDSCDPATGQCGFTATATCNATPAGQDILVFPQVVGENSEPIVDAPIISFIFEDIEGAGETTVLLREFAPESTPPPAGFRITGLSGGPVLYDIESTAILATGSSFMVCFDYSTMDVSGNPNDLSLVHEVGGEWIDITSSNDTVMMILCGIADSFSNYAIFELLQLEGPFDPVEVGTEVFLGIAVGDPPFAESVQWQWGDNTSTDVMVTTTEVVTGHSYSAPGVFTVTARLVVGEGEAEVEVGSAIFQYVVVFDPSAGFVTGGGWFNSPQGANAANPDVTGKANFGFVSKYTKGDKIPSGSTEFQFKAGDLNFRSSTYDWLVIAGARAQFKGKGVINGIGNFGFILTAVDEVLTNSTDTDLFRIKIWDEDNADAVLYDNNLGASDGSDPTTAINVGSIVIHKPKK